MGSKLRGEGWDFGIASAARFTVSLPEERNSLLWALLVLVNGELTKKELCNNFSVPLQQLT